MLHLPDQVWVLDRKRETALRYPYEFETAAGSTSALARGALSAAGPAQQRAPVPDADLPADPQPGAYAQVVREARDGSPR